MTARKLHLVRDGNPVMNIKTGGLTLTGAAHLAGLTYMVRAASAKALDFDFYCGRVLVRTVNGTKAAEKFVAEWKGLSK